MTHPKLHAAATADKAAVIMAGSGETVTYRQLDERSNQCAHLFRSLGLQHGDTVAFCLENRAEFFDLVWGAQRAGLIYVAISCRLTPSEMDYILNDSGAKALFSSNYLGTTLDQLQSPVAKYIIGGAQAGWTFL